VFTSILVALDGSAHAHAALREAADIARCEGASLTIIAVYSTQLPWGSVVDPGGLSQDSIDELIGTARSAATAAVDEAVRELTPVLTPRTVVVDGAPAPAILEEAQTGGHDLIVVGSRGRGAATSIVLGSVSQQVLHHSRVPLLIVHLPDVDGSG
jgi:nucleotide-binding universal stress UspA family protein